MRQNWRKLKPKSGDFALAFDKEFKGPMKASAYGLETKWIEPGSAETALFAAQVPC
jgi:hypothetical protein